MVTWFPTPVNKEWLDLAYKIEVDFFQIATFRPIPYFGQDVRGLQVHISVQYLNQVFFYL